MTNIVEFFLHISSISLTTLSEFPKPNDPSVNIDSYKDSSFYLPVIFLSNQIVVRVPGGDEEEGDLMGRRGRRGSSQNLSGVTTANLRLV